GCSEKPEKNPQERVTVRWDLLEPEPLPCRHDTGLSERHVAQEVRIPRRKSASRRCRLRARENRTEATELGSTGRRRSTRPGLRGVLSIPPPASARLAVASGSIRTKPRRERCVLLASGTDLEHGS